MGVRHGRAVRVLRTAASTLMFIGMAAGGLLTSSAPAQAQERCSRCGDLGSQCKAGCGHTPGTCKCQVFTADKGPSHIDSAILARYPKALQETYEKVFSKRCQKCHTLARPINTDFTPSKWEEYVKKMMRKPGSGIKTADAKRVWEFLVYDTAKRKPGVVDKAPASEREVFNRVVHECGS